MKRRIFAAVLAAAMVLSLAACGGGNSGGSSSSNPGSSSSAGGSGASSSQPDGSTPDGSPVVTPDPEVTLTLNKTEVTLNKAGATFQLRYTAQPDTLNYTPVYGTDNAEVAAISADGTITAVAPGTAVITVEYGGATAECTVTCDWKVSEPAPKPDASKPEQKPEQKPDASKPSGGSSSSSGSGSSSAAKVDLSSFYTTITGKYQFAFMMEADDAALTNFFAGLSDLNLSQRLVYLCGMSPSPNGDFVLVQVSDSKDVDTVKAILQARIDYMVGDGNGPGGAFYPMEQTMWEENARVAANGNYVMLIAHENCDDIVNEFNALF